MDELNYSEPSYVHKDSDRITVLLSSLFFLGFLVSIPIYI